MRLIETMWCIRRKGILSLTFAWTRRDAIGAFVRSYTRSLPWRHYRQRGYRAVKVRVKEVK